MANEYVRGEVGSFLKEGAQKQWKGGMGEVKRHP